MKTVKGNIHTYELTEENGEVKLKRYNDTTKMWVTLSFNQDKNISKKSMVKNILKEEYINSFL